MEVERVRIQERKAGVFNRKTRGSLPKLRQLNRGGSPSIHSGNNQKHLTLVSKIQSPLGSPQKSN
jgi:hypothetical protein